MRKIIAFIILLYSLTTAKAECASSGIWCWPNSSIIKKNPVFVITFYGQSQDIVPQLGVRNFAYLSSGKQKISLTIKEIHTGEFGLTQVLLKPSIKLTEGLEYELLFESLPQYQSLEKWNTSTKKSGSAKWTVSNDTDIESPKWVATPKYDSKTMVEYGCGPAKWVNFNFQYSDKSNILIKTTVKSLKTLKKTTYYLDKEGNQIKVGHGMCSGAFHFDGGDEYEVVFSLMDQSGNFSSQSSKPIRFSQPIIATPSE